MKKIAKTNPIEGSSMIGKKRTQLATATCVAPK